jgi:peptidoglycan/LPS O-acetylase OafA/YrhL
VRVDAGQIGQQQQPVRTHRLEGLSGLRFIAAASVVIFHFGAGYMPDWSQRYFNGGGYLVDVFFILSGFLLGYAYIDVEGGLTTTRAKFLISRVARLYPAYILALALSLPHFLDILPGGEGPMAALKTFAIVVLTLTFTQAWVPGSMSWNQPAWSLSNEMFFYGTLALIAGRRTLQQKRHRLVIAIVVLLAVTTGILSTLSTDSELQRLPILRVAPFLLAAAAGAAFQRWRPQLTALVINVWQLTGFIAMVALVSALPPETGYGHVLVSLVALGAVTGLAVGRGWLSISFDIRIMRTLGDASYGIYIYQVGVFYLLLKIFGSYFLTGPGTFVFMLVLVLVSVLSNRVFEGRMRRLIERKAGRVRRQPRSRRLPESGNDSQVGRDISM